LPKAIIVLSMFGKNYRLAPHQNRKGGHDGGSPTPDRWAQATSHVPAVDPQREREFVRGTTATKLPLASKLIRQPPGHSWAASPTLVTTGTWKLSAGSRSPRSQSRSERLSVAESRSGSRQNSKHDDSRAFGGRTMRNGRRRSRQPLRRPGTVRRPTTGRQKRWLGNPRR
jgi:hypothetical protein